MSEVSFAKAVDKAHWNALLGRSSFGHFFQTWQWANLLHELRSSETRFFTLKGDDGDTVGALALKKEFLGSAELPGLSKTLMGVPLVGPPLTVYRWRHGPVLLKSGGEREILSALLEAVERHAQEEGILAIEGVTLAGYTDATNPELSDVMRSLGYEVTPSATYLVDLTPSEDELLSTCDRSVRKNIRRCGQEGVKVERVMDKEGWKEFAGLFRASRRRQGLPTPPQDQLLLHGDLLSGDEERLLELFVARHNGRAIAALAALAFNGWLTEAMSANSDYSLEQRIPAQDLLKWEIMLWGKSRGFRTFDLAGVAPSPKNEKEAGIKRFKAKFGGRHVEYGTYRKVFRPTVYRLLTGFRNLKRS